MAIGNAIGNALTSKGAGAVGTALKKAGVDPNSIGGKIAQQGLNQALSAINKALFSGSGRSDPAIQFSFYLEINGIQNVKFRECSGLEWTVTSESFHEGGNNRNKVHLIGPGEFKPLVLKKGFHGNNAEFFGWIRAQQSSGSASGRRNVALVVTDEAGSEVCRFDFYNAFCSRYQGPSFNATQSEIAFEEIEITYDWFDMKPGNKMSNAIDAAMGMGIGALGKL